MHDQRGSWRRRSTGRACRWPRRSRRCTAAIGVEPTKPTALTRGSCSRASTASLSPLTTLKHAGGQARLEEQLGEAQRHGGVALGRLEDEGVAAGERRAGLPQRDHGREVERGDARDHAERLAHRVHVDAGAGAVGVLALEQVRGRRRRTRRPRGRAGCRPSRRGSSCRARRTAARRVRPCRLSTRSRNLSSTRARFCGFHVAHSRWASAAAAAASVPRPASASDTRRCTSPVLGS